VEFEFDEDQRLLQQSVRETLAKTRALPEEELWATYTELGWLEAPPVELAIVLDELGYVADPTPFLATATWFAPLAGRLPAGSGAGVFDGAGRFVLDADRADEVALLTSKGVQVVSGAEIDAERIVAFDSRLHLAHVRADGHQLAAGSTRGCTWLTCARTATSWPPASPTWRSWAWRRPPSAPAGASWTWS